MSLHWAELQKQRPTLARYYCFTIIIAYQQRTQSALLEALGSLGTSLQTVSGSTERLKNGANLTCSRSCRVRSTTKGFSWLATLFHMVSKPTGIKLGSGWNFGNIGWFVINNQRTSLPQSLSVYTFVIKSMFRRTVILYSRVRRKWTIESLAICNNCRKLSALPKINSLTA